MYLCQVSEHVSCGACCGLYNISELCRAKLEEMLLHRTEAFDSVPRTEEGIYSFQKRNEGTGPQSRPFPQFYHCPFLGLIGKEKCRVGCLLHPDVPGNNGGDYRILSWYGQQACQHYFCPSTRLLPDTYQVILKDTADNWYDFGLVVTEHVLVIACFQELERGLGRPVASEDFIGNVEASNALRELFRVKSTWPYRSKDSPGPCNFFFENGLYPRPDVFRASSEIGHSPHEDIFRELDSAFSSNDEIDNAGQLLDRLFARVVLAIG